MKLQHPGFLLRTTEHIQTWMMVLEELRLVAKNIPDLDKKKDPQFSVLYQKEL